MAEIVEGCAKHYDRQGKPLSLMQWAKLMELEHGMRRVAFTKLADGKIVSTVWLGLCDTFLQPHTKHLIFETMVFPSSGDYDELDCERYATVEEATTGHEAMVEKWSQAEAKRE